MIEFYIEGDDGKTVVSGADGPVVAWEVVGRLSVVWPAVVVLYGMLPWMFPYQG